MTTNTKPAGRIVTVSPGEWNRHRQGVITKRNAPPDVDGLPAATGGDYLPRLVNRFRLIEKLHRRRLDLLEEVNRVTGYFEELLTMEEQETQEVFERFSSAKRVSASQPAPRSPNTAAP